MCYNKYLCAITVFMLTAVNLLASFSVTEDWSTYVGAGLDFNGVKASAMGSSGSVYIGGYSYGGEIAPDGGYFTPVESPSFSGAEDGFIAEINASGVLQWYSVVGNGDENDEVRGVAEYDQSVFAAACQERASYLDDGTDAYLYSFSKSSGSFNWSSPLVIGAIDATNAFNAVTVDTNGNIYAVGYTSIDGLSPTTPSYQVVSNGITYGTSLQGDLDACVVKVSPTGSLLWVHYLGGANFDSALTCTIGTNGYLYVGGETYSPGWVTQNNGVTPSASHKAGFLVKMSTDGDHLWSTYLGGSDDDSVASLAFEKVSGNLFAAGTTKSSFFMNSTQLNSHGGQNDGFVTSITDSGSTVIVNWTQFYGSTLNDTVTSIQQLDDGQMVVGGSTASGGWVPDADNSLAGGSDGFLTAFDSNGDSLWGHYLGGSDSEELYTLATEGGLLYAGGTTFSADNWVSGSFRSSWDHFWYGSAASLGFLVQYKSDGYIPDLPVIITQPQSISVEEEQNALFSIEAESAEPLSYQWSVNDSPVADATNTSFTLSVVTLSQDGDEISCAVSNIAGSVFSETAVLTVTPIPMGWITIDLSPAAAVSNGVAWSIDSGTNWFASGDVINVLTGDYAIAYRDDVFGWAAPATTNIKVLNLQTNSLSAVYTQIFYTNYREISATNVTVFVDPPGGTGFWTLREIFPVGLTPFDYPPSAFWNSSTRTLFYTEYDSSSVQVSYSVTGTNGIYQVNGSVNFDGATTVATVGDKEIVIGGAPPVVPDPDIIGFAPAGTIPGNFLLTFISIVDQSYLIETNGAPAATGWAQQSQVNGAADQTTTFVPASKPSLFYRVRTPAP